MAFIIEDVQLDIEAAAAFERRLRRLEEEVRGGRGDRAADEEKTHSP